LILVPEPVRSVEFDGNCKTYRVALRGPGAFDNRTIV
jgi:hypothetical protein